MANNNSYLSYGGDLMVFITSGATKMPVGFSTSGKLDISLKTRDISSKDSGDWTEKAAGKFDWNMGTDGLASFASTGTTMAVEDLYSFMCNKCLVGVSFGTKCGTSPSWGLLTTKKYFSGCAYITSLSLSASDGETTTYSVSLEGSGSLSIS